MGSSAKRQLPPRGKKRGRPSLVDIQKRSLRLQAAASSASRNPSRGSTANPYLRFPKKSGTSSSSLRRSFRRSRTPASASPSEDEEGRGSGRRRPGREKEVNLILEADEEDVASHRKRRAVADADHDKAGSSSINNSAKATDSSQEQVSDTGPMTPLPDQKLLVFILDGLQKKDTHGVFSEPVDSEELPDYHDIVDHPMDFQTVREKLSSGKYSSLEQFQEDVFLISSNAMCYNELDTVYFRQAKAIHDLAKRNFESLRKERDGHEAEQKPVVRRGRPPNKFKKAVKALGDANEQNVQTVSWLGKQKLDMNEDYSESSLLKGFTKYGKTSLVIDESRRSTYKPFGWSTNAHEHPVHAIFGDSRKFLVPVGINMEHACARSIARFAADFGSIGWAVAAKRLEWMLPLGTKFGPAWVREDESLPKTPLCSASPDPLPELNSLSSIISKSDNDKLVQTTDVSANENEIQSYSSRTPQSVLSPSADISTEARNSSSH
ncbi:bromodomain-containing protein 7 [Brachypodium distachyon]|uniref:Bromo domain-containing protein n=1 Tax=Brachypodium distachyon TaxID=15368 RepID=A0A0Q3FND5_BRADI|nr:bromodomain-containing protein 7 [Brachypodium distachyon]KQK00687.1 hypothetical protein BRADI_3g51151v3 [Brachypodium distachyon]|eukprot:XP_010235802.1 bromodomain-containing protein 7 [Brachypodium distachyon]